MPSYFLHFLIGACGFLAAALPSLAIQIDFSVRPQQIYLGESAQITFTIEGKVDSFDPKLAIPGLQIHGPQTQFRTQTINRKTTQYTTYQYSVLPEHTGTFSIGPFEISDGSGAPPRNLEAVTLTVLPPQATRNATGGATALTDLLQLRLTSSKPRVFPQEVFEITLELFYQQVNLANDFQIRDFTTAGLDIEQLNRLGSVRVERDGVLWNVMRWRAKAKALHSGRFELAPTLTAGVVGDGRSNDFFMFRPRNVTSADITAPPLGIDCQELPSEGRPASFNGAIGEFNFRAGISTTEISQGDPITLSMVISGQGNMDNISAPGFPEDPRIRRYDPRLAINDVAQSGNRGRKGYEQILMPMDPSITEIPAIEFSYFNPQDAQYHVVRQGPFPLQVTASTHSTARVVGLDNLSTSVQATKSLGADIQYLKPITKHDLRPSVRPWYLHHVVLALQSLPVLGYLAVFILARRRDRLANDPGAARRIHAPRAAKAALQEAERHAEKGETAAVFGAIQHALCNYAANRFNLGIGEISKERLLQLFKPMHEESAVQLAEIFSMCENFRYGGHAESSSATLQQMIRTTRELLSRLEGLRS